MLLRGARPAAARRLQASAQASGFRLQASGFRLQVDWTRTPGRGLQHSARQNEYASTRAPQAPADSPVARSLKPVAVRHTRRNNTRSTACVPPYRGQVGPLARGQDVLPQVEQIDRRPDAVRDVARFARRQRGVVAGSTTSGRGTPSRAGSGTARRTSARCRARRRRRRSRSRRSPTRTRAATPARGVPDWRTLSPSRIRMSGCARRGTRLDDVVAGVRVDGRPDFLDAALDLRQELHEPAHVVALRKALALHQPAGLRGPRSEQEAVGGDQIDPRVVRPARQERLQQPRGRALPDRDAAGDADDVWRPGLRGAKELRGRRVQLLRRRDVQVQQARQRQVDLDDLLHRDGSFNPRNRSRSASDSVSGVDSRSRAHSSRANGM